MKIRERIAKLIDVKTIITMTMLGVFSYLSITQAITPKDFLEQFKLVIIFFFGVQAEKNSKEDKNAKN